MTQPTNYTPTTDFSQQESINASGRSTVNTAALDAEFANIETTLDQTVSNLSLIQRDDGRLKDVSVEIHTISPEVLNLIGGGYALRGLWLASTDYAKNDICSNGAYTYVCRTAHTAGGSFDGQDWIQFGFTSGADAAQAAAAAQGSATSASGSAIAAGNSATAAAASASSISGSVASASSYASIATTKAGNAASSATAAGNSATSAAASAASINTTTFALKTGVGSSGTWPISINGNAATATNAVNGAKLNIAQTFSEKQSFSHGAEVTGDFLLGYGNGSGGAITQGTSKSTTVVLNKPSGQITTHSSSLAANSSVSFTVTCGHCTNQSTISASLVSGFASYSSYSISVYPAEGSFVVTIRNLTGSALAESLVLNYAVFSGATT